uniref:Uncharacterized protein n=1 Tax=Podoviridae sp. ct8Lf7 TaxID=2827723 RepID=A0A8S5S0F5_9CAUD|nr:MAG TPA: hypothetical protein [Podoviridae sp. ct8Lf7]DAH26180.1 MAG TPA: hypothetical protein [Bacteriophage sp.]
MSISFTKKCSFPYFLIALNKCPSYFLFSSKAF